MKTKYDYVTIYTGSTGWIAKMDEAGEQGFRMVNWLPWNDNHQIIMEREKAPE